MLAILAAVDFRNPLFWAVFIAWIMSVVLHEFAHGVVAYWGGDWTIRERGGLTLNPLQYVDPVNSLLLPAVFLLMGGIPLPGGVTYVRRDLLRSRVWESAVSAAGPAMNLLLFLGCVIPLHPRFGWVNYSLRPDRWSNIQIFLASTAVLQMISVLLNLMPVPPLDGFQILSPYMKPQTRQKLTTPPTSTMLFIGLFALLWYVPSFFGLFFTITRNVLQVLGFDEYQQACVLYALPKVFSSGS